jgi:hypothetical protein
MLNITSLIDVKIFHKLLDSDRPTTNERNRNTLEHNNFI